MLPGESMLERMLPYLREPYPYSLRYMCRSAISASDLAAMHRPRCSTTTRGLIFSMRLILALLLLLQLDPVVGAALCLQRERAASQECAMPERSDSDEPLVAPGGAQAKSGCAVAQFCAQPSPVVAQLNQDSNFTAVVHRSPASWDSLDAPLGVLTPPFHPPKA